MHSRGQHSVCPSGTCRRTYHGKLARGEVQCRRCHAFLTPAERVSGSQCHRPACRFESRDQDRIASHGVYREELKERIRALAVVDAERRGIELPILHEPALVPSQDRPLSSLPAERREKFLEKFTALVEENFEKFPDSSHDLPAEDFGESLSESESHLVGKACATCQGWCCQGGGESLAYLDHPAILRMRTQHPDYRAQDIVESYEKFLGSMTYTDSCYFHGEFGCLLPPEMRAAICHRYLCADLTQLQVQAKAFPETVGYVAAIQSSQIQRISPLDHSPDQS
ncbi:hypothetical protein [Thalassoglobus neptunius]|uniref:hypothetical protein n=1 Tax=Thalassoglobus neptunius TaxID=1938619 RepID=UPI0011B5ABBC|nr:hypothetical protein [Thalassoglobus neptunius]